jgi:hypothetical protein
MQKKKKKKNTWPKITPFTGGGRRNLKRKK